jgi:hypothetical protein
LTLSSAKLTPSLSSIEITYAVIEVPPSSGAFHETRIFAPTEVVVGAAGVAGI